ncbi:phosphotransferase [Thiomicrorhabdus sp. zzn3]|uniref:phosphotransferase n=1 Tax=Thiomicrorhabdus sp. zzn3 TaxID=3039775 RepID=UPI002436AAA5|nr:phosphotransferase [Thiomicrorhabdus sp. zzn3]MDG6777616.1 phosphotransferase [Thiomicrorhabdus sp. zzn3]
MATDFWLPDAPAFLGFHPPELDWQAFDLDQEAKTEQAWSDLFAVLHDHYSQPFQLLKLQTHHPIPYGFFRVVGEGFDHFLKVVTAQQADRLIQANEVAGWLNQQGMGVSLLQNAPGWQLNSEAHLLSYRYLNGRFGSASITDMQQLGEALAKLHLALADYPDQHAVEQSGTCRHNGLKARLKEVRHDNADLPEEVKEILYRYPEDSLDVLVEDAQMVHGDLNMGNVWFTERECVFLDLEDSLTAWFSPMKDLAFVLERFVLTHNHREHQVLGEAFLQAYYRMHHNRFNHPEHAADLLQALAVRALLILIESARHQQIPLANEWKKFVFLYKLADHKRTLLQSILCRAAESASSC